MWRICRWRERPRGSGNSRCVLVLGAGNFRILRQLLTESLLLAFLGCGLGLVFAIWGVDALIALGPEQLPRLQAVHMDARVLGFAALITVLTSVIFGLAPALATLRTDVNQTLKDGDRGTTPASGRGGLRNALVIAETCLALVLLAGAGLLMRTFINLQHVSAGFQPEHVLTSAHGPAEQTLSGRCDEHSFLQDIWSSG